MKKIKQGLSVVILTKNNERVISDCLRSLQGLADEIIVVDGFSSDNTLSLCREHGCTIFQRAYNKEEGFTPDRNFADQQCKYAWIFHLDSDETVSSELAHSLKTIVHSIPTHVAYDIPRKEYFMNSYLMTIKILRLYKNSGFYWHKKAHEELIYTGSKASIPSGFISHKNQREGMRSWMEKMQRCVELEVYTLLKQQKLSRLRIFFNMFYRPLLFFFGLMLYKKLIFRGFAGFIWSVNAAIYEFLKYAEYYERVYSPLEE